jgi:hypothetical protein
MHVVINEESGKEDFSPFLAPPLLLAKFSLKTNFSLTCLEV